MTNAPQIIYAKSIREKLTSELVERVQKLPPPHQPKLNVILVGNNPASILYTESKKKFCEKIGAICDIIKLPETISEIDFLHLLDKFNNAADVHGIIVQLPLPTSLKHLSIGKLIHPKKDVDGFHPENIYSLYSNESNGLLPCTPKGIVTLLRLHQIKVDGAQIVIIGRSLIVGKPLSILLTNLNGTVTLTHTKTKNLKRYCHEADIIISAIGIPNFIDATFFSPHKKPVVIDVGMNKDPNGKTCGDVHFKNVLPFVSAISPVPGGVGPMTIISLAQNLITACENQIQRK